MECQFCEVMLEGIDALQLHHVASCPAFHLDAIEPISPERLHENNEIDPDAVQCMGNTTSLMVDEYSSIVLEDRSNDEQLFVAVPDMNQSIDIQDLLNTYAILFNEKKEVDKLLKEAVEARNEEVAAKDWKITVMQEDLEYLRTENKKLKSELKVNKQNQNVTLARDEEESVSVISESIADEDFCVKTSKELNDLREDMTNFRKYMYKELSVLKGCYEDSSSSSSSDEFDASSSVKSSSDNTFVVATPLTSYHGGNVSASHAMEHGNTPSVPVIESPIPMVPGPKLFNRAHIPDTIIFSDSTVGKMTSRHLKDYIDIREENIILKKFPGHTAEEINYYCDYPLLNTKAKRAIILAGTNDISRGRTNNSLDESVIVNNIMGIAHKAKAYGAEQIYIASIVRRRGLFYKDIVSRINILLQSLCKEHGYYFMDNNDIVLDKHISGDGIHPNELGHVILKMNILKCMNSFNPYLCDFIDFYERALT